MKDTDFSVFEKALNNKNSGVPFVMANIVEGLENSPGRTGFKLLCEQNGESFGNAGGGNLEYSIIKKCREIHQTKQNCLLEFVLTEESKGLGMLCGGKVKVFFEYFPAHRRAFIFGAGHLGKAIVPILNSISFYTIVIDNRPEFAQAEKIPAANEVISKDYLEFLSNFTPQENDAVLIFTHGHKHDYEVLDKICEKNGSMKYIGMIGSKIKVRKTVEKIKEKNFRGNLIEKVFTPVGLNIAKITPQEIAIAIAAEILAVYNDVAEIRFMKNDLVD